MAMRKDLPGLLELLQERSDISVIPLGEERGFALYQADLTEWRLRFSDKTPFIVIGEKDACENLVQVWNAILEIVQVHEWQYRLPILLVEGIDKYLRQRVVLAQETHFTMAVLDDQVVERMRTARSCRLPILDALLAQIPRRELLPYETAAPVTASAFFNRQSEVRHLMRSDTSYAITGVRRIGKTSLLMETLRLLEEKHNCVLLICSTLHTQDDFKRELIRALRPTELKHLTHHLFDFSDFLKRMPRYMKGRIILFLDEVDNLIEVDRVGGYEILSALRDARTSTRGGWRFIFAGSTTLDSECANSTSPLYNMMHSMPLGPFSYKQTKALVCQPFETIRVTLRNATALVERVYRETGGHPNLVQHYCILLADLVDQQGRDFIEVGDLSEVYTSRAFRDYVLRSFEINTGPMEQLIVYLMADRGEFTDEDVDLTLKEEEIGATLQEIDRACHNLEKIAVLRKTGHAYQFTLSLVPIILKRNYEIHYLVTKAREELRR
jgi:hypothetical protein